MAGLKPYSEAFFAIALEKNKLDLYEKESMFVLDTYKTNEKMRTMILHPQVTARQKNVVLEEVFKGKISEDFFRLFSLILRKGRESFLDSILEGFLDLSLGHKNILEARVVSAKPLSEAHEKEIALKLASISGKQITVKTEVDPSLIAGIKIFVDGKMIDLTVKKDIKNIKNAMKGAY